MNTDPENFESLKKLLAVKKHEQPPPGYFDQLPTKIWQRIEAEDARPSFWMSLLERISLKPTVAYAFGLIICAGVFVTIGTVVNGDKHPTTAAAPAQQLEAQQVISSPVGLAESKSYTTQTQQVFSSTNQGGQPFFSPTVKPGDIQPAGYRP